MGLAAEKYPAPRLLSPHELTTEFFGFAKGEVAPRHDNDNFMHLQLSHSFHQPFPVAEAFYTHVGAQEDIRTDGHELVAAYGETGAAQFAADKRSYDLNASFLETLKRVTKPFENFIGRFRPTRGPSVVHIGNRCEHG